MRVLLIEDEEPLRLSLTAQLQDHGCAVDSAGTGMEGQFFGDEYDLDVAVVDIGLPDVSGIDVIRHWRSHGRKHPVLILTARGRWQDKVVGLEAGADDYLVKPFHFEELLARIRALVRRAAGWAQPVMDFGAFSIDITAQSVIARGAPVALTAYEYRILEYLVLHAGQVISKTELTEHIYAQDFDRDSNVIEVLVGRLRRKLDPDSQTPLIETLRGRGYRFGLTPVAAGAG